MSLRGWLAVALIMVNGLYFIWPQLWPQPLVLPAKTLPALVIVPQPAVVPRTPPVLIPKLLPRREPRPDP